VGANDLVRSGNWGTWVEGPADDFKSGKGKKCSSVRWKEKTASRKVVVGRSNFLGPCLVLGVKGGKGAKGAAEGGGRDEKNWEKRRKGPLTGEMNH